MLLHVLSSVEAAQTADVEALLRHCAAVLTWQDAMWMADEADEAGVGVGGVGASRGSTVTTVTSGRAVRGYGDDERRRRKEFGDPGARESNPRASYGACQETHVLHYLERLFCTHVDALHESALANVVARCRLFQSLCAFLDERGDSIPPEDRRAGLYALSGIIATESFASHRRLIVGGVVGDGAVTVGNAILPMGKSRGVGRGRRSGRMAPSVTVRSSDETARSPDETARTTRSPRWTPESFESPLGSWNRIGGKDVDPAERGASSRCSTRLDGFGETPRSGVRFRAGPRPTSARGGRRRRGGRTRGGR